MNYDVKNFNPLQKKMYGILMFRLALKITTEISLISVIQFSVMILYARRNIKVA